MSSITPSGYRFGATYVGTKKFSPNESFPLLFGDLDPSGNLNATVIHQPTSKIHAKFGAQVRNLSIKHFASKTILKTVFNFESGLILPQIFIILPEEAFWPYKYFTWFF